MPIVHGLNRSGNVACGGSIRSAHTTTAFWSAITCSTCEMAVYRESLEDLEVLAAGIARHAPTAMKELAGRLFAHVRLMVPLVASPVLVARERYDSVRTTELLRLYRQSHFETNAALVQERRLLVMLRGTRDTGDVLEMSGRSYGMMRFWPGAMTQEKSTIGIGMMQYWPGA